MFVFGLRLVGRGEGDGEWKAALWMQQESGVCEGEPVTAVSKFNDPERFVDYG